MLIVFTPAYVNILGVEAYGLVGFFSTLFVIFSLLDFGFSPSVSKFVAQLQQGNQPDEQSLEFVQTVKMIYWFLAILVASLIAIGAPWIAEHWLRSATLDQEPVGTALILMGISIGAQFPFIFYTAVILGLQRHVRYNVLTIVVSTVRAVGALAVLSFISPTIEAFFLWQAITNVLQTAAGAWTFRSLWPARSYKFRFTPATLRNTWRFAAGMTGVTVTGALLWQLDKLIISKLLPLETFGYYSLATLISSGLLFIVHPFYATLFPRFSQLISMKDDESLKSLYHRSTQILATIIFPVGLVIAFFSEQILYLWTQDTVIAERANWLLTFTILGNLLNCLMFIPRCLQFSYGWTRLALLQNIIVLAILLPLFLLSAIHFGVIGPAVIWFAVNLIWVFASVHFMHHRIFQKQQSRWYLQDVGPIFVAVLVVLFLSSLLFAEANSKWVQLFGICFAMMISFVAACISSSYVRSIVFTKLRDRRLLGTR